MVALFRPDEILVDVEVMLEAAGQVTFSDFTAELASQLALVSLDGAVHIGLDDVLVQVDATLVQQLHSALLESYAAR